MIFRLTQKLAAKLKTRDLPVLPLDENPLDDWSAHVFLADRKQYLLVTNTQSLYSIVTDGKGVTNAGAFVERVLSDLREFLSEDDQPIAAQRAVRDWPSGSESPRPAGRGSQGPAGRGSPGPIGVGGAADDGIRFARVPDRRVTGSMNELVISAKYCLEERGLSPYEIGFELNTIARASLQYALPREVFGVLQTLGGQPGPSFGLAAVGARVFQFKVTLQESAPPIWRRIQVADCTLDQLHEHIQTAMGWTNSHLSMFEIDGTIYGDPDLLDDDFGEPFKDSTRVRLSRLIPKGRRNFRCEYEYDFGDGWRHEIELEELSPAEAGGNYPICVAGGRACPPEDCGGIPGYEELLEALSDPTHKRHADATEWHGGLESEKFDAAAATRRMKEGLPDWRADDSWS
jgi:hypothetical protein